MTGTTVVEHMRANLKVCAFPLESDEVRCTQDLPEV
jgi:hypothetical protein